MALNWGKGAEAVSEGLIRQADIGGLMYKQAASVESSRKAGELKQQEQAWAIGVQFAKRAESDYQTILEAIIEAESTEGFTITPELQQRFEDAQTRRNDAYANLGAISPGGGGAPQFTFGSTIKQILSKPTTTVQKVEDWRKTFAEGKTPKELNTWFKEALDKGGLAGNAEARKQLEAQFIEVLQQKTTPELTAGARGGDIEGTGLISQAAQEDGRLPGIGGRAVKSFSDWVRKGLAEGGPEGRLPFFPESTTEQPSAAETSSQRASELDNAAMQRYISQMSQQGQQYWEQYMQAAQREGRSNAISTLRETYNALSDADRQIVLQLQSALGI